MRKDMFKVIVERPRAGRSWAGKSKTRYLKGETPRRITGHRLVAETSGNTKYLNENLAPLRRFLSRQVGRPWDKVFSEVCETLDTGSTVKMHVREHIDDFIVRKVHVDIDGVWWGTGHWGQPILVKDWHQDLYVDPRDGLIKRTERLRRTLKLPKRRRSSWNQPAEDPATLKRVTDTAFYVRIKGVWYDIQTSKPPVTDGGWAYGGPELYDALCISYVEGRRWQVTGKTQMSGKALRFAGLSNE